MERHVKTASHLEAQPGAGSRSPNRNFGGRASFVSLCKVSDPKSDGLPLLPTRFLNRELSWLEFNQRVLDEALDPTNPLLERLKFFCISHSNLDEFFEVRVAGIKQQIEGDVGERGIDSMTPSETFRAIRQRVQKMVDDQYRCWRKKL